MISQETRIEKNASNKEVPVTGYFLTITDLARLVREFQVDCFDGFVSSDISYLENWLKKHKRI